jgi:flagellar L-ring protein precursor FlgH
MRIALLLACIFFAPVLEAGKKAARELPAIDVPTIPPRPNPSPGSLFAFGDRYSDLFRDLRASQPGDIVTVLVSDRASAVSRGTTASKRKSSVKASVSALAGPTRATGPWANLAGASGDQALDAQGATTRDSSLATTISLQVVSVTPAGNLVLQGAKQVQVNSESQTVTVRGVVRAADLSPANTVPSDRLANLEIFVNGRGVVGDAVRRPFILYRILLGLLPF